jgi:PAS domain S-box-containing protein
MNVSQVVAPEYLEEASRRLAQKTREATPAYELGIISKDGQRVILEVNSRLICEDGKPTGVQGMARDITERKRAEEALIESDRRFRDLFYDAPVGYHELDTEGRITCINTTELSMLGYSSEEMIGHHVWEFIEEEEIARDTFAEKLVGIKPLRNVERSFRRKDGTLMEVQLDDQMLNDPSGRIIGIRATMQDITERKRAEAERQVIAEIVQSVITTTNLDELFKLAHQAIKKILPAESCFIALHNLTTDVMHCEYWVDQFDPAPLPRPLGKGFSSYMLRTGQPLLLTKEFKEQMYERGEVQKSGTDSLSWLGVPLRTRSRTIGVLVVQDYNQELAYNQRDLEFLSAVGDQLGLAIERKRIELELKANEMQLIEAQQIANLGSWEWDVQANKVSWSDELYRIYGLQPQEVEVTYEGSLTWVHPDDRKLVKSTNEQTLHDKVHPNLVYRIIRQDGTVRVLQANGRVTDDDTGRIIKMVGTVLDITEQKRADESLRESEERYELAVEGSNDGLWDWNMETNDVYFSPRWKSMIGYEEHEVENIFKSWEAALHPDDRGHAFDTIGAFVDGRTSQYALEHRLQHKDGTYRWILARAAILRDANGKPYRMSGSHTDITERKQLEFELTGARDAALESVRLKSQFLANMSHEIRTPMNGVIGMTGLLLDTELNDDQRDCAETIRSSGEALLTIINDILDFSRIEAGKLKFDVVDFDLRNAVEGAVELLAKRARERNIEFASFVHSNVPTALQGDPGRLRQVLTNLTGNALKFTEQGEVVVTAEKEKETDSTVMIRFSVKDTGIGINEATQKKLFQAFTQADGSTTRKYGGTGLGLSISKQLVDLMGGQIGVISTPGQGSTFWFTASFDKQPAKAGESLRRLESLENVRVLIVDDNATNRKILSHQLSSWGRAHDEAESGLRALELMKVAAAEGRNYDLAILDFLMPGMDGFELAEAIHADPNISRVRMVLLTSAGERGDGVRSRNAGISAYLSKPVRQSQLFDCLIAVMSESVGQGESRMSNSSTLVTKHNLKERKTMSLKLILLAEDNIVNQKVAIRQLQKLGYRCDAVANGREAIEALSRIPYDLVLMDCQMPEMDGYEATGEIRRTEVAPKHTPIVAMTAHALEGDREKCIGSGMDDYITKPVQLEELTRVLNAFLGSTKKENREIAIETSPVDLARTHGTMGDEPTQFSETHNLYMENMSENLGQLEAALALGDCNEIESIAHSCAGASAICGMTAMVGPFRELEIVARERDLTKASRALAQAKEEFERLRTLLDEQVK